MSTEDFISPDWTVIGWGHGDGCSKEWNDVKPDTVGGGSSNGGFTGA